MNREIKFRAWHKDAQKMANVMGFHNMHLEDKEEYKYIVTMLPVKKDECIWKYRNIILMQYTGLKDKNGTEIYEGDICWTYEIGIGNLNRIVIFDEGSFCLYHDKAFKAELRGWKKDYIEVIGNIYEHISKCENIEDLEMLWDSIEKEDQNKFLPLFKKAKIKFTK
jgi:uncharacterized phage protein (TIGR01671 family)